MAVSKKSEIKVKTSFDFYSDLGDESVLKASFVRSKISKGLIEKINIKDGLPDGYFFVGAEEVKNSTEYSLKNYIITDGIKIPIFAEKKVNFEGQVLGILFGPDADDVEYFKDKFDIILKSSKKSSSEEISESEIFSKNFETENFDEKLLESQKYFVCGDYSSIVGNQYFSENCGALVIYKSGKLNIFAPVLDENHLFHSLQKVTGLSAEKFNLTKTNLSAVSPSSVYAVNEIVCSLVLASLVSKKSIKLVLRREEQRNFVENTVPVFISHKASVNEEGQIFALDTKIIVNCGCYNAWTKRIVERLSITAAGIYNVENYRLNVSAKTNPCKPSSFDLNKIDSQCFFAVENFIQKIAFVTGIPALDLRLNNIRLSPASKSNMPYLFAPGKIYETLDYATRMSDFVRKHSSYRVSEVLRKKSENTDYSPFNPPLRGIGLACGFEGFDYLDSTHSSPFKSSVFGAVVCELELNPESFREELREITFCCDIGKIENQKSYTMKIRRNIQNCLKELVKNERIFCPKITIKFIESEKETKDVSNLVSLILPAAYTSALSQSLSLTVNYLPLSNTSLYNLIELNKYKNDGLDEDFFEALTTLIDEPEGDSEDKTENLEETK